MGLYLYKWQRKCYQSTNPASFALCAHSLHLEIVLWSGEWNVDGSVYHFQVWPLKTFKSSSTIFLMQWIQWMVLRHHWIGYLPITHLDSEVKEKWTLLSHCNVMIAYTDICWFYFSTCSCSPPLWSFIYVILWWLGTKVPCLWVDLYKCRKRLRSGQL